MGVRRVSVRPELKPDAKLVTSGPYRFVRHPMYTALLLFTGGLTFSPFAAWKCIAWCILVGVLLAKSKVEERHLNRRFTKYEEYSRRTKRLIPFVL
jgi:protein-S-isoprenylcysteine O-methyltransferase Ste14